MLRYSVNTAHNKALVWAQTKRSVVCAAQLARYDGQSEARLRRSQRRIMGTSKKGDLKYSRFCISTKQGHSALQSSCLLTVLSL